MKNKNTYFLISLLIFSGAAYFLKNLYLNKKINFQESIYQQNSYFLFKKNSSILLNNTEIKTDDFGFLDSNNNTHTPSTNEKQIFIIGSADLTLNQYPNDHVSNVFNHLKKNTIYKNFFFYDKLTPNTHFEQFIDLILNYDYFSTYKPDLFLLVLRDEEIKNLQNNFSNYYFFNFTAKLKSLVLSKYNADLIIVLENFNNTLFIKELSKILNSNSIDTCHVNLATNNINLKQNQQNHEIVTQTLQCFQFLNLTYL